MIKLLAINKRQKGSSMIEILVSMVIVALGLLGHANLMMVSSKGNQTAYLRSQATLLSYDMIERLRLNKALAKNGRFNIDFDTPISATATTIDVVELRDWLANLADALPAGDGKINVDGAGNVIIEVQWEEVLNTDADGSVVPTKFVTQTVI
jgi:type IV pilus assembly protein PilV